MSCSKMFRNGGSVRAFVVTRIVKADAERLDWPKLLCTGGDHTRIHPARKEYAKRGIGYQLTLHCLCNKSTCERARIGIVNPLIGTYGIEVAVLLNIFKPN